MDISAITQLIGSVGFPIACCLYMMVVNDKTIKQLTEAVNALTESLHIIMTKNDIVIHDMESDGK